MEENKYQFGMIGLGTMGRNIIFNMSDHGYSVAGFDKDTTKVDALEKEAAQRSVFGARDLKTFVNSLLTPRVIMLLVPAGHIVDDVVNELKPLLSKDDLIMDCGNSHFIDTNRRLEQLAKDNLHFMGVGVSGGEAGARFGPSIMPGGSKDIYDRVAPMLQAISAKVKNEPCVTYLGSGSAGHYVKMVHNGIEYGLMQLISEAYHLLKKSANFTNDELHNIFSKWNEGKLQSFLIEITAAIFAQQDDLTTNRLVDMIKDSAKQNGTGAWTSEDAMSLLVPVPTIDISVSIRNLSAFKEERDIAAQQLKGPSPLFKGDKNNLVNWMEQALYFSMITTYAQGMSLLYHASNEYKYGLKLEDIASIWRGGCIIRAELLENIRSVFSKQPDLSNLILNESIAHELIQSQDGMRKVVQTGAETGVPLPAMMASLSYYDSYRSGWLPANLVQAQRDYFGAHTYERNDRKGIFHTQWNQNK